MENKPASQPTLLGLVLMDACIALILFGLITFFTGFSWQKLIYVCAAGTGVFIAQRLQLRARARSSQNSN